MIRSPPVARGLSSNKLNAVARQLNEQPRETLQFYSPAVKFAECVATIN
jgi:IS30 family transposase